MHEMSKKRASFVAGAFKGTFLANIIFQGTTRLSLIKIPYFREIILYSFCCDHCFFENSEIQSASEIKKKGTKYTFTADCSDDMERPVVKSDTAVLRIEDLDIEIPAGVGKLTNIEGVIGQVLIDLEYSQRMRNVEEPKMFAKINNVILPLTAMFTGHGYPFTITLDDPAGNSWIEPHMKDGAKKYLRTDYPRTSEQNALLGLNENQTSENESGMESQLEFEGFETMSGLVDSMPCQCPGCSRMIMLKVQLVDIPYFKQVFITATNCDACGYRTNDVKTGGEIPNKGQRIWLHIQDPKDLSRDILKSETCLLEVPECNIQVVPGTMAGRFTTVEGLLIQIRDDLRGSIFDIDDTDGTASDSMPESNKQAWAAFFSKLDQAIKCEFKYTIKLEDPLANSYAQSFHAPEPDPQIVIEEYERTADEEEELGLNDMKTHKNDDGEYVKEVPHEDMKTHKNDGGEHVKEVPHGEVSEVVEEHKNWFSIGEKLWEESLKIRKSNEKVCSVGGRLEQK